MEMIVFGHIHLGLPRFDQKVIEKLRKRPHIFLAATKICAIYVSHRWEH
jgi:hypothetical protein